MVPLHLGHQRTFISLSDTQEVCRNKFNVGRLLKEIMQLFQKLLGASETDDTVMCKTTAEFIMI